MAVKKVAFPLFAIACAAVCVLLPPPAGADMTRMTEEELSAVTGHGFSSFTLTQDNGVDIARMDLNMRAETFTEIDSMKLGYYGGGWDENWLGLSMGSSENDLILGGSSIKRGDHRVEVGDRNDYRRVQQLHRHHPGHRTCSPGFGPDHGPAA